MIDYTINNKFIKSEVYIKALNLLNNFYLKMYMTYMEDQIMNFILQKTAKSLYFSKKIGYLYKKIELNILKSKNKDNIIFFSNVINM